MEMAKSDPFYPCGSQWRKWDLHVHSPASHNFSGDWPGFVIQLGSSGCALLGINDYFSVAGYKELVRRLNDPHDAANGNQAYREALEKLREKKLLPVVECRMTNVVLGKKNTSGQRINFHLIFGDAVNPDDIETFIKGIKVKDQSIGGRYADPKFLLEQLDSDMTFKGKFVTWIPYDEYGGIGDIDPKTDKLLKEGLVYNADILGFGNRLTFSFGRIPLLRSPNTVRGSASASRASKAATPTTQMMKSVVSKTMSPSQPTARAGSRLTQLSRPAANHQRTRRPSLYGRRLLPSKHHRAQSLSPRQRGGTRLHFT
jgi:hypothetical protein